ncbi:MAG TPA: 6-phosphofructokinase [Ruminococcaceae bacterium]|nr:MAG: 6-phosphofructokinase [Clostridiales bacterium 41_21_two_genomes]HCK42817.1 6-phosphofructokinase [Oscillospiraceae bacterium]HCO37162.1 6-phosphofructokinase [Oscillospiraceae bacterium]
MSKNLIIGQSGGPTAVINSSLAGAIDYALGCDEIGSVYGMINGIEGFLDENIMNLSNMFEHMPYELNRLKLTPAMFLGSCRYKLSDNEEELAKVVSIMQKYDIGYFIYIGGNDSMDTVKKLSDYTTSHAIDIKIVGVPKTIDNDLNGIDHSPGFGSAAKYIASCVREVAYDTSIYSIKSVHIIEAMGRNAGWLTAASCLARQEDMVAPHLIYLPEVDFSVEQFVSDVKAKLEEYNSIIVVVSEGIHDKDGNYISAQHSKVDEFGHAQLSGTGAYLKSVIEKEIGCKVRALEPSVIQRSAGHISSLTDVEEAFNLGTIAVRAAVSGKSGVFSTLRRISDKPYSVEYSTENVAVVANTEKLVPRSWINPEGNDVTQDMVDYLRPLIEGVVQTPYRNGLPDYIDVRHLDVRKQKYSD